MVEFMRKIFSNNKNEDETNDDDSSFKNENSKELNDNDFVKIKKNE